MTRHLVAGCAVLSIVALGIAPTSAETFFRDDRVETPGPNLSPDYFDQERDGPVSMTTDPNGNLWAVWAYRNGAGFDVAVSRSIGQTWTVPTLIGEADAFDDIDPQLAFMANGSAFLVWVKSAQDSEQPQRVMASSFDGVAWGDPRPVSDPDIDAHSPAIFAGDGSTPVVGYLTGTGLDSSVVIRTLAPPKDEVDGGTSSPDPMPTFVNRGHDRYAHPE